ncbi:MAG: monofunctional biosynthetic peptidoglycan transglycosylase [Nevskia sp.]|nr:monofunctional biosynthetic peptidoglycan transglycosylase [Nevskia sp.]
MHRRPALRRHRLAPHPAGVQPAGPRAAALNRFLLRALQVAAAAVCSSVLAVLLLRWLPPPTTAFMLEADIRPVHQRWVDWVRISPAAKLAVVASEDQKFPDHWGFDFEAIDKAYSHNLKHRRVHGASTISQQTAKNLFLWSGRSYFRKALEAYFTLLLEALWPKHRILEMYLNIARFGPDVYGVEEAAQRYFGKPAARLDMREAALLAAVLPSPERMHVGKPSAYVEERAMDIEEQMRQLGPDYLDDMK